MMFILRKLETTFILVATLMAIGVSSLLKANRRDVNVVSNPGHMSRSNGCDEDCRRNKRRRKLIETKDYMNSVRNGGLTQKDQDRHLMLDRLMSDYSREELPMSPNPTEVLVEIDIKDISDISEYTMDYSMRCHLRQWYRDPRLQFGSSNSNQNGSQVIKLSAADLATQLWVPDITFTNGRDPQALDPEYMTEYNTLGRLNSSGWVYFVRELDIKFKCQMDLKNYPFDVQKCGIYLESFKYHIDEMYFSDVSAIAKKEPVDDFVLEGYESVNCTDAENPDAVPCHYIMMTLTRQTGYFILQVYMPSILVVMLSWIIFWIDMDSGNQMNLSILLVLTISTLNYGSQTSLPRVSYIKAIDVWFQGCLVFVCLSLLEAAFVSYISKLNEQTDRRAGSFSCPSWNNNDKIMDVELNKSSNKCGQKIRAERIHTLSRVIFPVLFVFFNIGYFLYYFYM